MARRMETSGAESHGYDEHLVRRLRKASVDRVLCEVTDPTTAREFWDLVQEVLQQEELRRPVPA